MISIKNVHQVYRSTPWGNPRYVLNDVSLVIPRHVSFGLLGPNGAGKTTLMKILLGLLTPTSGTIRIDAMKPEDSRSRAMLGYLPEHIALYPYLTGYEFLEMISRLYGMKKAVSAARIDDVLAMVRLTHAKGVRLKGYSKGMLQRIGLAQAILHSPRLLLLDEPLDGLDPIGRYEMREIITRLRNDGTTIIMNSHILSDVETICDSIGILFEGNLLCHGKVSELVPTGTTLEQFFISTIKKCKQ